MTVHPCHLLSGAVAALLVVPAAIAAGPIEVVRGPDAMTFGNCVPSLVVENRSALVVDYLQVDVALTLENGQERTVELKSAYREGLPAPIGPGATATLRQHLDTSRGLGVGCGDLRSRRVVGLVCEVSGGTSCAAAVSVRP